ncbi:hypothetical protein L6164_005541 [Bauhinia variegata]|uniref:Uncharacterized protein n=1 Tax=Bauhinia variegata TaxID=167791 RepID=A0ACB9PT26_BAUVA|nr:hypothetical protein L6164_005541 [Bauhinia variegata]
MAQASSITGMTVESYVFPALVPFPGSDKSYILGGAGVRGRQLDGNFIKFTTIGVYMEAKAIVSLAEKWKGKNEDELLESLHFFRDIVSGPFEKVIRGTKIVALPGYEYSRKVTENCVAHMKSVGTYGDAEAAAIEKVIQVFKDHTFPPGSSVFYKQSPTGTLTISFSKDGTMPEDYAVEIHNKPLSEAVLETMIGKYPVSPALKHSLATRLSQLFKEANYNELIEN